MFEKDSEKNENGSGSWFLKLGNNPKPNAGAAFGRHSIGCLFELLPLRVHESIGELYRIQATALMEYESNGLESHSA